MPSVSPKQGHLMAACANGALYKKCPPMKVAREFAHADSMLKRSAGGATRPLESGMDSKLNFGMGHGNSFFSTTPLMGHALSGSLPKRFAEGGEVKKPAGPSAKERREIRDMIERGKGDAISALRSTRDSLLNSNMPEKLSIDAQLDDLRGRLALKDGGEVSDEPSGDETDESPDALYGEYQELLEALHNEDIEPDQQEQMLARLAQIDASLEAMGIDVGAAAQE